MHAITHPQGSCLFPRCAFLQRRHLEALVRYSVQNSVPELICWLHVESQTLKHHFQPTQPAFVLYATRPNPLDIKTHFHSSKHTHKTTCTIKPITNRPVGRPKYERVQCMRC
jgi:hypothetical protein